MLGLLRPLFGAIVILLIARLLQQPGRHPLVDRGLGPGSQIVFAMVVLKTSIGQQVFTTLGAGITRLLGFAGIGAAFVFGPLGDGTVWGRVMQGALGPDGAQCHVFAFQVLPTIIFIAALFAILYYFGVMQVVVRVFAWVMHRVMVQAAPNR
jgi:CNT family concentrative nucleoside transporter